MVVVARGEPGTPFELVDTNRLWVIKRKGTTRAVANLKEASILTEFVRFIRGRHRRTETPVGARDRLLALLIEGAMRSAQNKKAPYKDKSRYELRHPTIVSRALRSGEFKLKSGINRGPLAPANVGTSCAFLTGP
jgi:hypothetical protein